MPDTKQERNQKGGLISKHYFRAGYVSLTCLNALVALVWSIGGWYINQRHLQIDQELADMDGIGIPVKDALADIQHLSDLMLFTTISSFFVIILISIGAIPFLYHPVEKLLGSTRRKLEVQSGELDSVTKKMNRFEKSKSEFLAGMEP